MGEVTFDFSFDEADLQAQVQPILIREQQSIQRRIVAEAQRRVPVRSGFLRSTIQEEPATGSGRNAVTGGVIATAPYARFVHDGTRPHLIVPRRSSVLVFEIGGRTVFTKRVHHPGTRPNPFIRDAMEAVTSAAGLSQTAT